MSFGGFGASNTGGGFGGFGSNNNNTNTTGGFGSNTNTSTGGSMFGSNTGTAGGFGGTGGNSPFGANKPAFGAPAATSGGGMFGGGTSTSGGFGGSGGFGSTTNTNTGGGFGGSTNTGGGLFGSQANKPASTGFGGNPTGGSIFGGGASTGSGFGGAGGNTSNTPGFGGGTTGGFGQTATNTTSTGGGFGGFGQNNAASTAGNNNSGTGGTPFSAVVEKDGATSQNSHYQSITFQQPYQNKSFEELRVEDYMQGRKSGNTNGQAGSFGTSTGFGGFGGTQQNNTASTGGGLFGGNNNASTTSTTGTGFGGFGGTQQNNTSTFGGFGQNKPAAGGFGQAASSATPSAGFGQTASSGGGLFGNNASNSFGGTNNAGATGGGLFGNNNQQQQQDKPAFGGFGGTSGNTGTSFGQSNTNTSGGGGLFGGGTNTTSNTGTGFGGFGGNNNQQQQQNSNPFGGTGNNTGFGASQNKPATAGLFGSTPNATGGTFGQNQQQQQQQGSTAFGGGNTNTGGSLFGQSQQNKPATGGLFGGTTGQSNTGGGGSLFGGANQNQNQNAGTNNTFGGSTGGSSLFGPKPATGNTGGGSLFGQSTTNTNTGGSLFGGIGQSQNQNQQNSNSNSLFGGNNQQGQQANNNTSLFGQSNNTLQQSQPQQSSQLHTTLTATPYGNEQLFASLASPSPPIGPLATPLSGARPTPRKGPSLLASTRLNSPAHTPRGTNGSLGRSAGYGFSYSNYGTPNSQYSNSLTPGASSLLRQSGSFGRSSGLLSKSYSTSNLRVEGNQGEGNSLLRSGAFSPSGSGPGSYGRSSVRKLHIDRSLRSDLFGPAPSTREDGERRQSKSVSFDNAVNGSASDSTPTANNGGVSTALVRTEEPPQDQTPVSSSRLQGGARSASQTPQNGQANGNGASGLSTVPEDGEPARSSPASAPRTQAGKGRELPPGDYYMDPPLRQLQNMSRSQLQKVRRLRVGRENAGFIDFGPCDLTIVDLDQIMGNIVQIESRNATVYPDKKSTPAMGQGLNVPSVITLEQTWPRKGRKGRNGEVIQTPEQRLIENLKKIEGTEFMDWNRDTGVWRFRVQHFTTYGLDDDDDDEEFGESQMESQMESAQSSSVLSDAPPTATQQDDYTLGSVESSNAEEDTFQFKLQQRSQRSQQEYMPPGGFAEGKVSYDFIDEPIDDTIGSQSRREATPPGDDAVAMADSLMSAGGPVQAPSPRTIQQFQSSQLEEDPVDEQAEEVEEAEIPGAFSAPVEPKFPRSILKPSTAAFVSPQKLAAETWEEKLQQTLSPRKRDRRALKDLQQSVRAPAQDDQVDLMAFGQSTFGQSAFSQSYLAQKSAKKGPTEIKTAPAFETSIDIMNSLWEKPRSNARKDGFEIPAPKKQRFTDTDGPAPSDADFLGSFKSKFTADGTLVYAGNASPGDGMDTAKAPIVGQGRDVRFARFTVPEDVNPTMVLTIQQECTVLEKASTGEIPHAFNNMEFTFNDFEQSVLSTMGPQSQEHSIWRLCSILFDAPEVAFPGWAEGIPEDLVHLYESKARLDTFASFWVTLCPNEAQLRSARTEEEKALLYLTVGDVTKACEVLIAARDFKLATIIAQLPADLQSQQYMGQQVEAWKQRGDWSEMSDAMRTLYSLASGSFCAVGGTSGPTENRSSEFCIAEKSGLSWEQSFALRVHYGGFASLEEAVDGYVQDLQSQKETVKPTSGGQSEGEQSTAKDTLWSLLQLAAKEKEADSMALVEPRTVSGSLTNTRLPWQLANLLTAAELITLPNDKMDCLTRAYAAELELRDSIALAAWVLLHLYESVDRKHAIKGLLERKAGLIADPTDDSQPGVFEHLTDYAQIPSAMIWKAKALHAQAVLQNPSLQASYLLQAHDSDAAHEILLRSVGPSAVVEQDYSVLQQLLLDFENAPPIEQSKWDAGGQVFADFAQLTTIKGGQREAEMGGLVRRLERGLAAMGQTHEKAAKGAVGLEARVALVEMGMVVEDAAKELGDGVDTVKKSAKPAVAQDVLARYGMAMAA